MPTDDRRQQYARELDAAAELLTRVHPIGRVKAIGRMQVFAALRDLFPEDDDELTTPEWIRENGYDKIDIQGSLERMFAGDPSQPDGAVVPAFRTRGRVRQLVALIKDYLEEDRDQDKPNG